MSKGSMYHVSRSPKRIGCLPHQCRSWCLSLVVGVATVSADLVVEAATPTIVSGDGHYLALTANGDLYSWGRNDLDNLGSEES